ncbi:MAG: S8 family serine peptidase, partial [Gammaproteobacteria bacterium]|nr:S8 family serine peptidase [Gammaproteobacteria bacterium]
MRIYEQVYYEPAIRAQLSFPSNVAREKCGEERCVLYIADTNNHRIRKVDDNGIITTAAGNGSAGYGGDGGSAAIAKLNAPADVAVSDAGDLYIADTMNHRIRKVDANGIITTAAGNGTAGYGGNNGGAIQAQLSSPGNVVVDDMGNLYVADADNHVIRMINTDQIITTAVGNGIPGYKGDGGSAIIAQFKRPAGITLNVASLYIADTDNHVIRGLSTNILPIANFTVSPAEGVVPLNIELDAGNSSDPDGSIIKYEWTISAPSENYLLSSLEEIISLNLEEIGVYAISLRVTDNYGAASATKECPRCVDVKLSIADSHFILISPTEHTFPNLPVSTSNSIQVERKADYWPGRVIVRFSERTRSRNKRSVRKRFSANLIRTLPFNTELWRVADVETAIAAQRRRASSEIEHMEPDYVVHFEAGPDDLYEPNDPSFSRQWGLHNIGQEGTNPDGDIDALEAWRVVKGMGISNPVVCAVIDSGMDTTHPDLQGTLWVNTDGLHGYNFVNDNGDIADTCGHGTQIAGIIGAVRDNETGIAGISGSVKIMGLKISQRSDTGEVCSGAVSDIIRAVEYAAQMGAKCINMGFGLPSKSEEFRRVMNEVSSGNDILFVASAGNAGVNTDTSAHYPSGYDLDSIISVCATNIRDKRYYLSNYGPNTVDLCAPGHRILSTAVGHAYLFSNGTSMAAAYVSGAAALLWSVYPELTASELKALLMDSTDRTEELLPTSVTGGRLNLFNAVNRVVTQRVRKQTFTIFSSSQTRWRKINAGEELSGPHKAEFAVRNNTCDPGIDNWQEPNEKCTLEIHFLPVLAENDKTALLTVAAEFEDRPGEQEIARAQLRGSASLYSSEPDLISSSASFRSSDNQLTISRLTLENAEGGVDIYRIQLLHLLINSQPPL